MRFGDRGAEPAIRSEPATGEVEMETDGEPPVGSPAWLELQHQKERAKEGALTKAPTTSAYSPEAAMDAPSMSRRLLPSGEAAFTAA